MSFATIDWIFSIIILIFAVSGLIKGFIDNVFGKIAFVAGILLAYPGSTGSSGILCI